MGIWQTSVKTQFRISNILQYIVSDKFKIPKPAKHRPWTETDRTWRVNAPIIKYDLTKFKRRWQIRIYSLNEPLMVPYLQYHILLLSNDDIYYKRRLARTNVQWNILFIKYQLRNICEIRNEIGSVQLTPAHCPMKFRVTSKIR